MEFLKRLNGSKPTVWVGMPAELYQVRIPDDIMVEHPTGSGNYLTLQQIADDLSQRLINIFKRDEDGRRPAFGSCDLLQNNEHFRDYIFFYEYFHGDNGRGVGATHQTGWTGLVAKLIQPRK